MNFKPWLSLIFVFFLLGSQTVFGKNSAPQSDFAKKPSLTLDEIMDKVERRYNVAGFSAVFEQESTLKAMQITDTASGKALFKRPGMMRWEYEKPEPQQIITDGVTLWIYRPIDNQVMIGNALSYFGDGKGSSFLSDIKLIRKKFSITLENKQNKDYYILKLVPIGKKLDLSEIYLSISKKTFDIIQAVTYNAYGDETRIKFSGFEFKENVDDSAFWFNMPDGVDILQFEE